MFFWSLFQACSGMVHSFTQFVLVRIGMGIGEAPMNPCGVKVINDWFNIKERGRPMGFFNAASTIGVAISPPILAAMMLMMGWRGMFITIGVLGIFLAIGWYMLYRNREHIELTGVEQAYLNAGSVNPPRSAEFCRMAQPVSQSHHVGDDAGLQRHQLHRMAVSGLAAGLPANRL
jgi:MFS family permease